MNPLKFSYHLIPQSVRAYIHRHCVRRFCTMLRPMDLVSLSAEVAWSADGRIWDVQLARGFGGWVDVPNHSGGYHGLLRQWWTTYGLGRSCLLVSESSEVGVFFEKLYPGTKVVATDYYLDIGPAQARTDVVWNLYEPIPEVLAETKFGSVICQATVEHILDPVGVLRKLVAVLGDGGYLYLHTHSPLFPYHACPKDYLRFFPEWFRDVSLLIPEMEAIELYCAKGHTFAAYRKRSPAP